MAEQELKLSDLRVGDSAKVLGFSSDAANSSYQQRLLALGLIPDAEFTVVRVAPLGDPVELCLKQFSKFRLCLRKQEASILKLKRLKD